VKNIQDLKIIDQIRLVPNVFSKEECNYLIDVFEKHKDKTFLESSLKYSDKENKTEHQTDNFHALSLMDNKDLKALQIAVKGIQTMLVNYLSFQKTNFSKSLTSRYNNSTNNIRILKYAEGEEIKDHLDMNKSNRASCSINLNENYEGGVFSFFHGKYKINLKQGQGMIFPTEPIWIHGVEKIIKGSRYSVNCFLGSDGNLKCI
jgi:hypothetical protein